MSTLQQPDILLGLRRRRRVPLVLQQERAECGLACLTMLAAYYGKDISLDSVRRRAPVSSRGSTMQDLLVACGELQMIGRPLRLALSEFHRLRTPAVLHWQLDHFVVLVKVKRRSVVINDPACGRRVVALAELDKSFTGVALEVRPIANFEKSVAEQHVALLDFVRSYRNLGPFLLSMLGLALVVQLLALAPPIATQLLIDELTLGRDSGWLQRALAGLGIIMFLSVVIDAMRQWVSLYTGTMLAADTTAGAIRHLLTLPASFHQERHVGDLMSRIDSLAPIRQAITNDGIDGLVQLLIVLSTLSLMFFYSTKLMLVSLLGAMVSLAILAMTLPANRRFGAEALIHAARQSSSVMQTLRGAASVQSLGIASVRLADWQKHFFETTNARVQQSKLSIFQGAAGGIVATTEQLLFLGIGITGVVEKEITLGVLFAYMSLRGRFAGAATGLAVVVQRLFILRTHTDRVSDILLAKPQFDEGEIEKNVRGAIGAHDLVFGYPGGPNIIDGFHCDIVAGSSVVITGPSGCGKTTLLQLLSARLEPVKGFVSVDDIRARMWRMSALRKRLAIVLQDDYLFQGSIAENICAFDPAPDLLRIRKVASLAEIWADIEDMPMMQNTLIDDSASALSGGQRQRILLARALYQNPAVLFLDEATNQLDIATEERVLNNLQGLGMTLISVAHRPDVIKRAGHIITLS